MGATEYDLAKEVEFEVQIGNNRFPQYPIRSLAEAFYSLRKTLGINNSNWHSISLVGRWYRHDKFIVGIDLEKVEGADYTGYNNRNGDTMTVKIRNPQTPDKIFTTLYYDAVLEISDMGVRVSD